MNDADLFSRGAEMLALGSGIPLSQARLRVLGTDAAPSGPLFDATAPVARHRFRVTALGAYPAPFSGHPMRAAIHREPRNVRTADFGRTVLVVEGPARPDPSDCPHRDFDASSCVACGIALDEWQRTCPHAGALSSPVYTSAGECCEDCGAILDPDSPDDFPEPNHEPDDFANNIDDAEDY